MFAKKEIVTLSPKKVIGLETRTSFQDEINPITARISSLVLRYMHEGIAQKINHKANPGTTLCGYKKYDPSFQDGVNYAGPYTYFIGDEVTTFDNCPKDLLATEIPGGTYMKFTTLPGAMPLVIIQAWQEIWQMSEDTLGGKRTFGVDFESYDERAMNPMAAIIDIYVGIEKA